MAAELGFPTTTLWFCRGQVRCYRGDNISPNPTQAYKLRWVLGRRNWTKGKQVLDSQKPRTVLQHMLVIRDREPHKSLNDKRPCQNVKVFHGILYEQGLTAEWWSALYLFLTVSLGDTESFFWLFSGVTMIDIEVFVLVQVEVMCFVCVLKDDLLSSLCSQTWWFIAGNVNCFGCDREGRVRLTTSQTCVWAESERRTVQTVCVLPWCWKMTTTYFSVRQPWALPKV